MRPLEDLYEQAAREAIWEPRTAVLLEVTVPAGSFASHPLQLFVFFLFVVVFLLEGGVGTLGRCNHSLSCSTREPARGGGVVW